MSLESYVDEADSARDDYGEWVRVQTPEGFVYVWGCGCCPLTVEYAAPEGVTFEKYVLDSPGGR